MKKLDTMECKWPRKVDRWNRGKQRADRLLYGQLYKHATATANDSAG